MKYTFHFTSQAARDMDHAVDYIRLTLKNPDAALSLVTKIRAEISSLDTFPQRDQLVHSFLNIRAI